MIRYGADPDGAPTDDRERQVIARQPPELMTVPEAARWLGLGRSTLYVALADGRIPVAPIDIGGRLRLSRRQLERWLDGADADDVRPVARPDVVALPVSSVYDDVFRDLVPVVGPSGSPKRSLQAPSSSARTCA